MYWMLHFSEASRVRPCWPGDLKLHKEFQFPVGHSKDILPFDLGFCCAANRVKALAWVEQVQWRQPFQGEHAVCSGVDAEMNDPQHISQSEAKKFPTCFFLIEGWPRNCQALMAGKERPERSSIALHHQGNKATRTITKLPICNSWTILISWYWICDIRYMIHDNIWCVIYDVALLSIWYMICDAHVDLLISNNNFMLFAPSLSRHARHGTPWLQQVSHLPLCCCSLRISQSLPSWLGSLSSAQPLEEELMCLACRWDFADVQHGWQPKALWC